MIFELLVGRFMRGANNNPQPGRGTILGSLAVAQTELAQYELTRSGKMFAGGLQLAANGIAPDTALPTTTAKVGLFNGESDGGKTYFVDHLHIFLVSGTPAIGMTLWVCVSKGKLATPVTTMATGFDVAPTRGLAVASNAKWGTAITLPTGTVWHAVGSSLQSATANIGLGDQPFETRGGIAIPPGYVMGLAIVSAAGTTPLYSPSARWGELEADLE